MNPSTPNTQNLVPETNSPNLSQIEIVGLHTVPVELAGALDPNAWNVMPEEQKIQVLMQTGLTRYLRQKESIPEAAIPVETEVPAPLLSPVEVSPIVPEQVSSRMEAYPGGNEQVVAVVEENVQAPQPLLEEVKSPEFDRTKVFGYIPEESTVQNAAAIAESGPISEAKTWAATIVSKALRALFG